MAAKKGSYPFFGMRQAGRYAGLAGLIAAALLSTTGSAQRGAPSGEWRSYSGDVGSTKYAPLDQINKANVKSLKIAWRRPAVDARLKSQNPKLTFSSNFRATPLMVNGVLYS